MHNPQDKSTSKTAHFWLLVILFLPKTGFKTPSYPIFTEKKLGQNSSNSARTGQTATEDMKWKNPEKPQFFGVFEPL